MNNLIEQLKQTPKWVEFEKWWNSQYSGKAIINMESLGYICFRVWCNFPFEMQEGVFRKFIESQPRILLTHREDEYDGHYLIVKRDGGISPRLDTFEELIIWYFNN